MDSKEPRCLVCSKYRAHNQKFQSVATTSLPISKKPAEEVLLNLSRFMKNVRFKEPPPDAFLCGDCFNDIVEYDAYVIKLLKVQRRLREKFEFSRFGSEDSEEERGEYEQRKEIALENNSTRNINLGEKLDDIEEHILIDETDIDIEALNCDPEDIPMTKMDDALSECRHCGKLFDNKTRLKYHTDSEHKRKGFCKCTVCGIRVKDEEYLELHMNIHEGKTENECRYCPKSYTRKVNVIRHMQKHWNKMKFQCEKCGLRFSETSVLYNHVLQHEADENPLICAICSQSFKTKRTYRGHMITHREDRPRYSCLYCSKTFVEKYTLKVHMRVHQDNDEKRDKSVSSAKNSAKTLVCIICSSNLSSKELYNQHMEQQHDVIFKT